MPYNRLLLVLLALGLFAPARLLAQVLLPSKDAAANNSVLLNGRWQFKYLPTSQVGADSLFYQPTFGVGAWASIQTPGNWELQGFAEPQYGRNLREGTGLYRTDFTVPAGWRGGPVYLAFDGVQYGYRLWVNGREAGAFAGSFHRQTFDISRLLAAGPVNTLAVRVSTRPKGWEFDTNDDWSLSGIIRDVTLFRLPPVHLQDLVVKTFVGNGRATLDLAAVLEKTGRGAFPRKLRLSARLLDPTGRVVQKFALTSKARRHRTDTAAFAQRLTLDQPLLWSAETPHLYTLQLSLKDGSTELQTYTQRLGIREITWADGVLKLNGTPIKLRGVDHHDLSPLHGRAITEAEIRQDLKLIQEANINFIRTSHYPPHPRLLELCDSLGLYVMVEVPFGYGDDHLRDKSYLPVLRARARATVGRDKNHPCVLVWSVGNENPATEIGMKTGQYVKQLDATRPYCYPQRNAELEGMLKNFGDSADIYSPHYPDVARLRAYATRYQHPVILTEYAHALGLDFDLLDSLYTIIDASPRLAGGAIWLFADQGLRRRVAQPVDRNAFTSTAWADSVTHYDTHGKDGADGIVYANRVPQEDYWQVRRVYSPVRALGDTLRYQPGQQGFTLRLRNRYDFTNLSAVTCRWQLWADTTRLAAGTAALQGAPHDTVALTIRTPPPGQSAAHYVYLKIAFTDAHGYQFYEKTYPVALENNRPSLTQQLAGPAQKPVRKGSTVSGAAYQFSWSPATGHVRLQTASGALLLADGPYARLGRKATMAERHFTAQPKNQHQLLRPFLLTRPQAQVVSASARQVVVAYQYTPDSAATARLTGRVTYRFSDTGSIEVEYTLVPTGHAPFLEAGMSFLLPAALSEFRWIGQGPYAAYPGKDQLDAFGFYHLNSRDLYFAGNRPAVDCAVFSDSQGTGFALLADHANIAIERTPEGLVLSHNALVSGRFNKFGWPHTLHSFNDQQALTGRFTLVPLTGTWPAALQQLFGNPKQVAVPFAPFYHSYDQ